MRRHTPTVRGSVENDKQAADRCGPPTESIDDDLGAKTVLHVKASNRVVDRRQFGLDLDHNRDPGGWSNGEDVDRSSLTELGKGDLDVDLPALFREPVRYLANDRCVAFVEQPIDLAATPRNDRIESGVYCSKRGSEDSDRERRKVPALDQGDGLLRQPSGARDIRLTPSATTSKRAKEAPDSNIVHEVDRAVERISTPYPVA